MVQARTSGNSVRFHFGPKITKMADRSHEIERHLPLVEESYDQLRYMLKKQRHYFADWASAQSRLWFSCTAADELIRRRPSTKEVMFLNCRRYTPESPLIARDPTSPFRRRPGFAMTLKFVPVRLSPI